MTKQRQSLQEDVDKKKTEITSLKYELHNSRSELDKKKTDLLETQERMNQATEVKTQFLT